MWKDLSLLQQRKAFIDEYLKQQDSVSELCRRFSVSRKTAYKWIDRFLAGCELTDRSRRPHRAALATAVTLEEAIVASRKERPRWGPNKLRAALLRGHPGIELPSISTFVGHLQAPWARRPSSPSTAHTSLGQPAQQRHPSQGALVHRLQDFKGDFLLGKEPLLSPDRHRRL